MLLTGQPMHAFDADLVAGGRLIVRRARDGETIRTLDDIERPLDSGMCLIEDTAGPTSIAGIMGGARSEVSDTTTRVLMEAATWIGPNIQRTSARLALRTEASGRFEKQLQPEQTMEAQIVAGRLMADLCGARSVGATIDAGGWKPPPRRTVHLRERAAEDLLGAAPPLSVQREILERLGFAVRSSPGGLDVVVPHWRRGDVSREADLVEEVGRIWGLDKLPLTLPSRKGVSGRLEPAQRLRRRAEDALVGAGVYEILGWSFAAPDLIDRLALPEGDPRRHVVRVRNPMSEDQAVLRTTLLGSLLDNLRRNRAHGIEDVRMWELGAVYLARGDVASSDGRLLPSVATAGILRRPEHIPGLDRLPDERQHLAAVMTGRVRPATWGDPEPPRAGFYAAKGVLEALMSALRVPWRVEPASEPFLHPGRSARVLVGEGHDAGWLGELHPSVAANWDLDDPAAGFELNLGVLLAEAPLVPDFEDLTTFPAVREDLAVVLDRGVAAERLLEVVRGGGGRLLRRADVFDVYEGAQVGEGRRSLALRLEFRAADRTLTDEEVAGLREKIVAAVRDQLGGELRG
jgi:phenylalanyl-tRNA synthetase beta chain